MISPKKDYSVSDLNAFKNTADEIFRIIETSKKIMVSTHENPEGDAISSAIATGLFLKSLDKEVYLYEKDQIPANLKFLPESDKFLNEFPKEPIDLLIVVDCGEFSRIGSNYEQLSGINRIINIDHHFTNTYFGHANLVLPDASSAGEVLFYLFLAYGAYINNIRYSPFDNFLGDKFSEPLPCDKEERAKILSFISGDIALSLYTSILTDTGSFHYSSANKRSFYICSVLNEYNMDPSAIATELFETKPAEMYFLLGKSLNTLEFSSGGKVASMVGTKKMIEDVLKEADSGKINGLYENFVNYPRSIQGVEIAIFFRETGFNQYRLNFRSKSYANVAYVAEKFGGGGHKFAAGCKVNGDINEIKKEVYRYCGEILNEKA
ncbi:MAG: bifunctional oligoribonuclease/PAP phosphatase NrnA [Deltaproteobacteria bacterium]|jgi:phosphoesterase RecJ-like protein|uniref:Bifunctional oligoribonuclease/PAP phosphatase NrnA n=1 Tax=Candidatus Acidulodesulfobacterium acidiphilum TaxID=2597224 RepID=A0A520XFX3_9DELT|nr:bifunctional oligoribonuclease/PAP phosphatase NrnA [Deltaproteobacteria bacterium]MDA8298417.1 bifunctional oligoribonuclease/PAP phosphatase NrnA [Deltaproteobacteria bacterium]RZV40016.1 MAG: bifunctional oligoribonuclease/PAP phosphatase NrnA [Candidatus Acidulodesulfobacterium acidiphilum]